MEKLSYEEMLRARVNRNASYDGYFYVGVRTMKTYCLPSCKAKLALEKNIEFFSTREEAKAAGYRSCKRCRPDIFPDVAPQWLDKVLLYMNRNVSERINEEILARIAGVDISTIRRNFRIHFHVTPLAYHRKLRLTYAKKLIKKGVNHNEIPSHCGYRSNSGFRAAFFKEFGHAPGESHNV